jgi:hypothetical protein
MHGFARGWGWTYSAITFRVAVKDAYHLTITGAPDAQLGAPCWQTSVTMLNV